MAHWFGLRPGDLDQLTAGELAEYESRLHQLPPIGGVVHYELKK